MDGLKLCLLLLVTVSTVRSQFGSDFFRRLFFPSFTRDPEPPPPSTWPTLRSRSYPNTQDRYSFRGNSANERFYNGQSMSEARPAYNSFNGGQRFSSRSQMTEPQARYAWQDPGRYEQTEMAAELSERPPSIPRPTSPPPDSFIENYRPMSEQSYRPPEVSMSGPSQNYRPPDFAPMSEQRHRPASRRPTITARIRQRISQLPPAFARRAVQILKDYIAKTSTSSSSTSNSNINDMRKNSKSRNDVRTNINPQGVSQSVVDLSKTDSSVANFGHVQRSTGSHKPNNSPVDLNSSMKSKPTKAAQGNGPVTNTVKTIRSELNHLRAVDSRPQDKSFPTSVRKSVNQDIKKVISKDIPTNALAGQFRKTHQVVHKPAKNTLSGDINLSLERNNMLNREMSNSFEGNKKSTAHVYQNSHTQSNTDSSSLNEASNLNTDMLPAPVIQTPANEQLNIYEIEISAPTTKSPTTVKMMDASINPNLYKLKGPSLTSKQEVKIAPIETNKVNIQHTTGGLSTSVAETGESSRNVPMDIQTEVMNTNVKHILGEQTVREPVRDIYNGEMNSQLNHEKMNTLKSLRDNANVNEKFNAQPSEISLYTDEKQNRKTGKLSSKTVQNSAKAQLISSTSKENSPKVQASNNVEMVGISEGKAQFNLENTEVSVKNDAILTPLQTNEVNGQHIRGSQSTAFKQTDVLSPNIFSGMNEKQILKDGRLETKSNLKLQETVVDLTNNNQLQPEIDTIRASSAVVYKVNKLQPEGGSMTEKSPFHKNTASNELNIVNITPGKLDSNAKLSVKPLIVEENIISNQTSDKLTEPYMYKSINYPEITIEKNIPLEWQIQKHELQMLKPSTHNHFSSESVLNVPKEPNALKKDRTLSLGITLPDTQEKVSQNIGSKLKPNNDASGILDLQSEQLSTTNTATSTIKSKTTEVDTLNRNGKLSLSSSESKVIVVSPEIQSESFGEPLTSSVKSETNTSNINAGRQIPTQIAATYESLPTIHSSELANSLRKDRSQHVSIVVAENTNSKNQNQLTTSDSLALSIDNKISPNFVSTPEKHDLVDIPINNLHPDVAPNTKEFISASAEHRGQYATDNSKNAAVTIDKPYVQNTEMPIKKPLTLTSSAVNIRKSIDTKTADGKQNNINLPELTMPFSAHKPTSSRGSRNNISNKISTANEINLPDLSGIGLSSVQNEYPNVSPTASDNTVAAGDGFEKKVKLLRMLVDTVLKIPAGSALESVLMNFIAHRRSLYSQGSRGVSSQKPLEAYSIRLKERELKQQPILELISVSGKQGATRGTQNKDLTKPTSQTHGIDSYANTGHQTKTQRSYELTNPDVKKTMNALPAYSIRSSGNPRVSQRQQNAMTKENHLQNNVPASRSINGINKSNVTTTVFTPQNGLDQRGSKNSFNRHAAVTIPKNIQASLRNILAARARSTPEGKCVLRSICGTDGNVYLSNCFLPTSVSKACNGHCPCQQQPQISVPPHHVYQNNLPNHIAPPPNIIRTSQARQQPQGRKARMIAQCMNRCPPLHGPVCSTAGKTYDNDCKRSCSREKQMCVGPCPCEYENLTPQMKRLVAKLSRNPKAKMPMPIHRNAIELPEPAELEPLPTSASPCPCPASKKGLVCTSTGQTIMMCRARCQHMQIQCFGRCPC